MSKTRERIQDYIARIQVLEEEKTALTADIAEVYAEAKLEGFDAKAIRLTVKLLKDDPDEADLFLCNVGNYVRAVREPLGVQLELDLVSRKVS